MYCRLQLRIGYRPLPCPGRTMINRSNTTDAFFPDVYFDNITIPENLTTIFNSGTSSIGDTVCGAFDIQPRTYHLSNLSNVANGSWIPEGPLTTRFKSVMMDDKIEAVEGLIVDTRDGSASIGFRNHTLPSVGPLGGTWQEVIPPEIEA